MARSDRPISDGLKRKISLMCDVDEEAVVSTPDAPSIYDIPKVLHGEGLDAYIVRKLQLPFHDVDWSAWDDLLRRVHRPARSITIALVGKYVDLPDAYLSPAEALKAGGFGNDAKVTIRWVTSDDCENPDDAAGQLDGVDGILIPGGFGVRGIEGKIGAIRYAREHKIPVLGLCLGLQCMVIEVARDLAGISGANSSEFDPDTPDPVVATMADQEDVVAGDRDMGGTMRLGLYPASLEPGTIVSELYGGAAQVEERHRHRYEVNNAYRERLEQAGPGLLRPVARRPPGGVHRAAPRRAPVLRRHPGAPGVPVPPHPPAPAVLRPDRRRARPLAGRRGRHPRGGVRVAGPRLRVHGRGSSPGRLAGGRHRGTLQELADLRPHRQGSCRTAIRPNGPWSLISAPSPSSRSTSRTGC